MFNVDLLKQNPVQAVLLALGALVVVKFVFTALKGFYAHFLRSGKNLKKFGEWGKEI